jgi:hypothetical protein
VVGYEEEEEQESFMRGKKKKKKSSFARPLASEHAKWHVERRRKLLSPCKLTISPLVELALGDVNPKSYYQISPS